MMKGKWFRALLIPIRDIVLGHALTAGVDYIGMKSGIIKVEVIFKFAFKGRIRWLR
jgi:hypothetical protein